MADLGRPTVVTYRIPLPEGGRRTSLDVVDPSSSMVQRFLRREGLGAYEPATAATLLTLFELEPGTIRFVDVGANIGLYSHLCAAMFRDPVVHAFEPTPSTASIARAIARANRLDVEIVEAAVSDRDGRAELHLSQTSDASNSLVDGFKISHEAVSVELVRLDDHVARTGIAPSILKIDVETHEPEVLAGATETIRTHRPWIVVEVLRRRGTDHGPAVERALAGIEGYSFFPLSATPDWRPRQHLSGSGTVERDWLLAPVELPDDFAPRWQEWRRRLAACTPDRNPRPSVGHAVRLAHARGGWGEVFASARRAVVDPGSRPVSALVDRLRRRD